MQGISGFSGPEEPIHFGSVGNAGDLVAHREQVGEAATTIMVSEQEQMAAVAEAPYPWILSPSLDLLFACGGMMWATFLAAEQLGWVRDVSTPQGFIMWFLWIIGVHFLSNSHTSFGWHRVATSRFVSQKTKRFLGITGVVCLATAIPLACNVGLTGIAVRVYLLWLIHHYVAQSFGITMIYCLKRGYKMSKLEKDLMRYMFNLLTLTICVKAFTYESYAGRMFFGIPVPFWGPIPEWIFLTVLYTFIGSALAFAAMVVIKFFTQKQLFPLPALFNTLSVIGIFMISQKTTDPTVAIYIASFYHGSQNIVIATACHLKERGLPAGMKNCQIMQQVCSKYTLRYLLAMVAFGILLVVVYPRIIGMFTHREQLAIIAVIVMQGTHHFITEGIIWKLRDPAARKIIVA